MNSDAPHQWQASLITPSFRGDLALAQALCASIDQHVDPSIDHVLVVPRRDVPLFASLTNERRRIQPEEDLLPRSFLRLPLPKQIRLGPWFHKRLRTLWLTPHGLVRGWMLQQILKLSATDITPRDIFVFADSDTVFVRPFSMTDLIVDGKVRLYSNPGVCEGSPTHRRWHAEAARLLGLPHCDYFGADYIGTGITWTRDTLLGLQAHLARQVGGPWQKAICRSSTVSEYILYGVFAEHVLGARSPHQCTAEEWTYGWGFDHHQPDALEQFVSGLEPHHRIALIQSTEALAMDYRQQILTRLREH